MLFSKVHYFQYNSRIFCSNNTIALHRNPRINCWLCNIEGWIVAICSILAHWNFINSVFVSFQINKRLIHTLSSHEAVIYVFLLPIINFSARWAFTPVIFVFSAQSLRWRWRWILDWRLSRNLSFCNFWLGSCGLMIFQISLNILRCVRIGIS